MSYVQNCSQDFERYEKQVAQLWLSGGISAGTVHLYLSWVRRFYSFCAQHHLDVTERLTLSGARQFGRAYSGPRKRGRVRASSALIAKNALHAWAFSLRTLGSVLPEWDPHVPPPPLPPLLEEYCEFRRCHRGISEATVKRDVDVVTMFLSMLKLRKKTVATITVSDLDAFVEEQASHRARKTVSTACGSLRSFLRFLHSSGRSVRDLGSCMVVPRVRPMEQPVRALPWSDVKRILGLVDRSQPMGKRDFAMLLMMVLYGLGAAEILSLKLDDINWQSQVITLHRPKTGVRIELPLLTPIAKALTEYLRQERPRFAATRRVFLSAVIPYAPLTSGGIRHRIREYAQQAGVTAKVLGAHVFRHTHTTRQVDAGTNLNVLGDILGHRRPSSTSVYVRVALRRLRQVGLPVPR